MGGWHAGRCGFCVARYEMPGFVGLAIHVGTPVGVRWSVFADTFVGVRWGPETAVRP
jgi:hypothetical protein